MLLSDYKPQSALVVPETIIAHPRFPVIDIHNHLGVEFGGGWDQRPVEQLLDVMDESGVQLLVDLDGGWGEELLDRHLDHFKNRAPDRFQIFGGVDWSRWELEGNRFGEWAARRLEQQVRRGAQGLKIWKALGLRVRDHEQNLVPVNDIRLDPIWATASELGIPVMIHIADPVAFFDPIDERNERYEELLAHPDWSFHGEAFPAFNALIAQFEDLILSHPRTTFIGAHVGCYAENLAWVANLLGRCDNLYVDISARIAELGRQPYASRRFFELYSDRIVFGTDVPASPEWYRLYYRFLESKDEYFPYGIEEIPTQGRWRIYGLDLDEDILQRIYRANALRILKELE